MYANHDSASRLAHKRTRAHLERPPNIHAIAWTTDQPEFDPGIQQAASASESSGFQLPKVQTGPRSLGRDTTIPRNGNYGVDARTNASVASTENYCA